MTHATLDLIQHICDSGCTFMIGLIITTAVYFVITGGPDDTTPA